MITDQDISAFMTSVDEALKSPLAMTDEAGVAIHGRVHAMLCPGSVSMNDMKAMGRTLFRRARLHPDLAVYANHARHLTYFTSSDNTFCSFADTERWIAAIRFLDVLQRMHGDTFDTEQIIGMEREIAVASSIARLRKDGYQFVETGERIDFAPGEMERCSQDLFERFQEVDGFRVGYLLLRHLQNHKRFKDGRYLTGRIGRPLREEDPKPAPPLGYLLNLAAANLSRERVRQGSEDATLFIFERAADIVAALDVETYSMYAHMWSSYDRLAIYLREMFIADHALAFRQITPMHAAEIVHGLFGDVHAELVLSKKGWMFNDLVTLMRWLNDYVPPDTINATLRRESFELSGIPSDRLDKLLDDISHDTSIVNNEYRAPDATMSDLTTRPLFATNDGRYFLFAPSVSALAFYEVAASTLREVIGQSADQQIGDAIEPFFEAMLRTRGIEPTVVSKKYTMNGIDGECDIVVETNEAVILIELKKKSMTRMAQAGDSYSGFVDLFGGALAAQEQLGQHEVLLLKHGRLMFHDKSTLDLQGRHVERIAVTLLDWGGTQDSMVLRAIIPTLVGASLVYPDATPQQKKQLTKVNKTLDALGGQQTELLKLGREARELNANWWFVSVPQIMALLKNIRDAEGFYKALRSMRSFTTGSLDFYQELAWWPESAREGWSNERLGDRASSLST